MSEDMDTRIALAVLSNEVKHLAAVISTQQTTLERQGETLEELIALKNQGKGSLWILITLGGLIGAIISNLKAIIMFFAR